MAEKKKRKRSKFLDLLNARSWSEASARLKEGASTYAVAEYMQRMGDYVNVKPESLARQLHRYREDVLEVKKVVSQSYIDKQLANVNLVIDDIEEMSKLILIQKERIGKDLKLEGKLPKLMALRPEISFLFDMLEKRMRLLSDLGYAPKAPDKLMVMYGNLDKLLEGLSPEERLRRREQIQSAYGGELESGASQPVWRSRLENAGEA